MKIAQFACPRIASQYLARDRSLNFPPENIQRCKGSVGGQRAYTVNRRKANKLTPVNV